VDRAAISRLVYRPGQYLTILVARCGAVWQAAADWQSAILSRFKTERRRFPIAGRIPSRPTIHWQVLRGTGHWFNRSAADPQIVTFHNGLASMSKEQKVPALLLRAHSPKESKKLKSET
jgi:hypothetical protein